MNDQTNGSPNLSSVNQFAADLHHEVERIWPSPEGSDVVQRQVLALCEEVGEIARAVLKRSHASRSPDGTHKGLSAAGWTEELHVEIGQAIGVALQLAHIEGMNVDSYLALTLRRLRERPCILGEGAKFKVGDHVRRRGTPAVFYTHPWVPEQDHAGWTLADCECEPMVSHCVRCDGRRLMLAVRREQPDEGVLSALAHAMAVSVEGGVSRPGDALADLEANGWRVVRS